MTRDAPEFRFLSQWRVLGTVGDVSGVLGDVREFARWWPSVYLDVDELEPGAEGGVGKRVRLRTKGWLPYTLHWDLRVTESRQPHGFVIETGGTRIAYSGDTGWFDALPSRVAGADLFICECTYHRTNFQYHLSHEELVANRSRFDCGRVIITHLGQEMVDRRATSDFEAADDGLTIRI